MQQHYVGPPQGYSAPPPQQQGYPPQQQPFGRGGPVQQAAVPPGYVPQFNPAADPDFVSRTKKDQADPSDHSFSTPELLSRYATLYVFGFVTAVGLVIWLLPHIIKIGQALGLD